MTIGPVQLLVLGFDHPNFQGEIMDELQRLRDNDLVRLIDGLAVYKDGEGNVSTRRTSQLDSEEMAEFGSVVAALIGLGAEGLDGVEPGAEMGADIVEERGGVLDEQAAWDVLADIPEDTAAALLLIEHRWAIPLRDTVTRAGGTRLASEFISPLDLVAVGIVTAEQAKTLAGADGDAL